MVFCVATVCSTGGELRAFEGLVHATARMYAAQVRREEEDLAQELRIAVWRAASRFDMARTPRKMSLERFVYGCIANKIKDFKRDAAREARRREDNGVTLLHIEDIKVRWHSRNETQQEVFDGLFHFASHEEVYGEVDEGEFTLPATVTAREADVLVLLMAGLNKRQVAERLAFTRGEVERSVASLRAKLADWEPHNSSRIVELVV